MRRDLKSTELFLAGLPRQPLASNEKISQALAMLEQSSENYLQLIAREIRARHIKFMVCGYPRNAPFAYQINWATARIVGSQKDTQDLLEWFRLGYLILPDQTPVQMAGWMIHEMCHVLGHGEYEAFTRQVMWLNAHKDIYGPPVPRSLVLKREAERIDGNGEGSSKGSGFFGRGVYARDPSTTWARIRRAWLRMRSAGSTEHVRGWAEERALLLDYAASGAIVVYQA